MSCDITIKTTGTLIDELVTNAFKTANAIERRLPTTQFTERYQLLRAAIDKRFNGEVAAAIHSTSVIAFSSQSPVGRDIETVVSGGIASAIIELRTISKATWQAQEIVMGDHDDATIAAAGRTAQRCNARRTEAIRRIDRLFGEGDVTITAKTYG